MTNIARVNPLKPVEFSKKIPGASRLNIKTTVEILSEAKKHGYGVPAINITWVPSPKEGGYIEGYKGISMAAACFDAMRTCNAPLILEISQREYERTGLANIYGIEKGFEKLVEHIVIEADRRKITQPFAINFDNARTEEMMHEAVAANFTSVTVYGSRDESFDDFIAKTRMWTNYCHDRGVSVESGPNLVDERGETSIENAIAFYNWTGVDIFVIAQAYYETVKNYLIDKERLRGIVNEINLPVCMHGGSEIFGDDIAYIVSEGLVQEIKFATIIEQTMQRLIPWVYSGKKDNNVIRKLLENERVVDSRAIKHAEDGICEQIMKIMKIMNNDNRQNIMKISK